METKELTEAQLSLQDTIISCIAKSETFLVKMQSYPEINTRLKSWSKKNTLPSWPNGKQWKDVEFDINVFIQKLSIIDHEKNGIKKKALIEALLKNNSLVASLTSLNAVLTAYEKNVDIAPFGIIKIKKETKTAMQKIIDTFTTELYNTRINDQLSDILKSYEGEDKKGKEKEEEAIKKAQQDREKARPKEYVKSAGQEKSSGTSYRDRSNYGYDDYGYDGYNGYSPSSYDSYSRYDSSPSSYDSDSTSRRSSGGAGYTRSATSGKTKEFDKEESSTEQAKDQKKSGATSQAIAPQKVQSPEKAPQKRKREPEDRLVDAVQDCLEGVKDILVKEKKKTELDESFADLVTFIKKELKDSELQEYSEKLSDIERYLTGSKSVIDNIKSLKIKLNKKPETVKADYKKQIKEIYDEHKEILKKLLQQIQNVENNWTDIEKSIPSFNLYALWDPSRSYKPKQKKSLPVSITGAKTSLFEDKGLPVPEETEQEELEPINEEARKMIEKIPNPVTFKALEKAIKTVEKEIKEFIK